MIAFKPLGISLDSVYGRPVLSGNNDNILNFESTPVLAFHAREVKLGDDDLFQK